MPNKQCLSCGAPLPAHALGGHCPRCLLVEGLNSGTSAIGNGSNADTIHHPGRAGSVLETLCATVGAVPRVLLRDTEFGEEPSPIVRPLGETDDTIRYRIDGEIARGGMGAILKGRDPDLGRDVAIKVLREDFRDNGDMVRRFVEEAQIGGQLQHPGVVPIYELGTFGDKRPFFSMKLVKGQTLADLLSARSAASDDLPRFLSIYAAIAQTMAYAHTRGVIHRDLKPSNVMVGSFGEVQVMDWGLAKVLQRGGVAADAKAGKEPPPESMIATARSGTDTDLSHAGSIMGTPSYMAPEQARGETDRIDERADVFALGSILCEILTGSPAFTGRSSAEIVRKASRGDTSDALARLDGSGAEAELIALTKDCLAVEPDDRPRDANAVSERVTAYLAGVQERLRATELARAAESARAEEAIVRVGAERRARRFQVGLAASILALTVIGGLSSAYLLQQRQARAARIGRLLAEASLLGDQARAQPDDVARWEKARDVLARIADDHDASLPADALRREVQSGLEGAKADRLLRERLVDIRSASAHDAGVMSTDAGYTDAFRSAGIDLDALGPAEAGARMARRPGPVVREMIAALDHWTAVRRGRDEASPTWTRLLAAARAADPDPDRDALRAALLIGDRAERLRSLLPLSRRADLDEWAPASLILLGGALADAGDGEAGIAVLRRAACAHPGDGWVHYNLGRLLESAQPPQPEEAIRAYSVARGLNPELATHVLAHALATSGRDVEADAIWRDLIRRRPDSVLHMGCFTNHLRRHGREEEVKEMQDRVVATARRTIQRRPNDGLAYFLLGSTLRDQGRPGEAIAAFRELARQQPDSAVPRETLAALLHRTGDRDGAIAAAREALRLQPDRHHARWILATCLREQGKIEEAIAEAREGLRRGGHGLADVLALAGRTDEAHDLLREVVRRNPDNPSLYWTLGNFQRTYLRDADAAIASFRRHIALDPLRGMGFGSDGHGGLGMALEMKGRHAEAIPVLREAERIDPTYYGGWLQQSLGVALRAQGDLPAAAEAFRRGIRHRPAEPVFHAELADTLNELKDYGAAIAAYREAIRLKPDYAEAHSNLGHALRGTGDFAGSLAELRRGHELGSKRPDWPHPSAEWVRQAERLAALVDRLPAVLKGDESPRDAAERLAFARMAYDTKHHATAARLWAEALEADPRLGDDRQAGHRYDAACAASRAASGQGVDAANLDKEAKASLRAQALGWLKADFSAWERVAMIVEPGNKERVAKTLAHWKVDADLASVRDEKNLAKLPEAERKEWEKLWADVDAQLNRAQGQDPATAK